MGNTSGDKAGVMEVSADTASWRGRTNRSSATVPRRPAEVGAGALEEGVSGRNPWKVSPQLARLHQPLT
jgi:hypothetical protein